MCGIVVAAGPALPPATDLARSLAVIAHRGPDGEGAWQADGIWMGNRRLAVLDLTAASDLPMVTDSLVLAYNGEIYNYRELRSELEAHGHRFRTTGDSEVVLRAYEQWGSGCLGRFNGMWSIALYDRARGVLFVARDRLGIKPLYLHLAEGTLLLASEPKSLLELRPALREVDEVSLSMLLVDKTMRLGDRSFYRDVKPFPAGHFAEYRPGAPTLEPRRYWSAPARGAAGPSPREASEQLGAVLDDSVRLRMRSDVPVGTTLSGGLDSTAVLDAMARQGGRTTAFTSTYDSASSPDESGWAAIAASHYPSAELVRVPARSEDWLEVLRRITWHMDGPGFSPAVFPLWQIMAAARERGIVVLLEGQGADELLGGYARHSAAALLDGVLALRSGPGAVRPLGTRFRGASATFSAPRVLIEMGLNALPPARRLRSAFVGVGRVLDPDLAALSRTARSTSGPGPEAERERFDRSLRADLLVETIPAFLQYGDALSMAHSIESRLPFLDYRLVELCLSWPAEVNVRDGRTKAVLRDHLARRGQTTIAARRDKRGFPTPAKEWLAEGGGRLLSEVLLDPGCRMRERLRPHALERLIRRFAHGHRAAGDQLYALLAAELWLQGSLAPAGVRQA